MKTRKVHQKGIFILQNDFQGIENASPSASEGRLSQLWIYVYCFPNLKICLDHGSNLLGNIKNCTREISLEGGRAF